MDDQERSMRQSDIVSDEVAVREALATHPWPRFGEALQARLTAITAGAPDLRPVATNVTAPAEDPEAVPVPHPPVRRRDVLHLREALATAALLVIAVGLALWATSSGRMRQARPLSAPVGLDARPVTSGTIASALDSQLYYRTLPAVGDPMAILRLDMRTGRSEPVWEAPRSMWTDASTYTIAVLSPDRSRVAVVRRAQSPDAPSSLYVSTLARGAREPSSMVEAHHIEAIDWTADGTALYYAHPIPGPATPTPTDNRALDAGGFPPLNGWEFHILSLRESGTGGLLGWGNSDEGLRSLTEAGEDRVLIRLDAPALEGAATTFLVDVDENARRVIVLLTNFQDERSDHYLVFDLDSGAVVDRIESPEDTSMGCMGLAVPGKLSCGGPESNDPDPIYRYGRLDIATHKVEILWRGLFAHDQYPMFSSPDGRWLVGIHLSDIGGSETAEGPDKPSPEERLLDVIDLWDAYPRDFRIGGLTGLPLMFFPNSSVLLTADGKLVDLDATFLRGDAPITLPWMLPDPLRSPASSAALLGWFANAEASAER